ncbi:MAG TPA: YheE family protein [Sporosarcina psychrophila]|uniref:YheE family protein n=1 Tax=Sporosarcina psychrophila TaxID=1476 RepID=A0A921FWT2_SPOPS|nr:YheE family protein [Sporosarcina psychrophila]
MLKQFQITKALFQNQVNERFSFSLNYKGNDFQGIYHEGVINWFNPHPLNKIEKEQLGQVESSVADNMHKYLVSM